MAINTNPSEFYNRMFTSADLSNTISNRYAERFRMVCSTNESIGFTGPVYDEYIYIHPEAPATIQFLEPQRPCAYCKSIFHDDDTGSCISCGAPFFG